MRLTVIGTGYLGATHAACMAELGHEVLGVDVDPDKVAALGAGRVPFHEPGLGELVVKHLASGRLRFTASYEAAAAFGQVHFVCVGTPQRTDCEGADLRYVDAAFAAIVANAAEDALLVGKSTVPVGTARRLADTHAVEVAWNPEFRREVDAINMRRRDKVVALARELCGGGVLGARIAVLGAAFKPDSDDIRDSPALNVAARLRLDGADVTVYDPEAMDNARKAYPLLGYAVSAEEALGGADLVLHLTEWPQFRELDPGRLAALVSRPRIVDGRGVLDADRWTAAGWEFRALGRPASGGEGRRA